MMERIVLLHGWSDLREPLKLDREDPGKGKSILATKIILAPLKKKEIVPTIVGNHPGKILNLGRAVVDQIT